MGNNEVLATLYAIICEAQYECSSDNEELNKFIDFLHRRLEEELHG